VKITEKEAVGTQTSSWAIHCCLLTLASLDVNDLSYITYIQINF